MLPTTASSLFALVATFAILSESSALPTRSASSRVSRRGRIYRRATLDTAKKAANVVIDASNGGGMHDSTINVHFNGASKRATDKNMGDHSIVVDASSSAEGSQAAGIKNSTINLTVISNANKRSGIVSYVADLLKRTPTAEPVSPIAEMEKRALASKSKLVARVDRAKRQMVTDLGAQESAYAAAIAAMDNNFPATTTSSAPVATGTPVALNVDIANTTLSSASDLANATSTSIANSTAPLATSTVTPLPNVTATIVEPSGSSLPPITLTVTLVPSGISGAYVDAAGLATSTVSSSAVPTAAPTASFLNNADSSSASSSAVESDDANGLTSDTLVEGSSTNAAIDTAISSYISGASRPPQAASTSTVVVLSTSTVEPVTTTVLESSAAAVAAASASVTSVPRLERRVKRSRTAEVYRNGKPVTVYFD